MTTGAPACLAIGIDATELVIERTGVGRYLTEILRVWLGGPEPLPHRLVLYLPSDAGTIPDDVGQMLESSRAGIERLAGRPGVRWQQLALRSRVNRDRPDVFFAPAYTAPLLLRVPSVLAIHDVSFAAHPEWYSGRGGLRLRWLTRLGARSAAAVVTLSRFSRDEIVDRLGVARDRVAIVPPGFGGSATTPGGTGPREPLVLFVGTLFTRRRLPDLIAGFARLSERRPEARLAIVGRNRTDPFEDPRAMAERLGLGDRVSVTSYLPDASLADLYGRAGAFAFLSEYEGFGMTPMEALAAGVPVVLLDTPVAREVYGDAAMFVRAGDVEAIASGLERLLFEAATGRDLVRRARPLIESHRWPRTAHALRRVIEGAAGVACPRAERLAP